VNCVIYVGQSSGTCPTQLDKLVLLACLQRSSDDDEPVHSR